MVLKVGFIGAGWVAGEHMKALRQMPEAQIVACTDTDEERAVEAAAGISGAGAYTDYHEMLHENELDAVWVCVPPHVHGQIELTLIEHGLPFFLEKPLANELETPKRVLEALESTDLIVAVGYMMRWDENVARLREFLREHEPIAARGAYLCGVPPTPWWKRKELSGGQIVEQSTHVYDLTRYLFGEVASVYCRARSAGMTDVEDLNVDEASICSLTFTDGMLCDVVSSCACTMSEVSLEVFCPDGRAKLHGGPFTLTVETPDEKREHAAGERGFGAEDRAFLEAVESGDPSGIRSTYADAFGTQRVTCAAEQSIQSGEPVRVG